VRAFFWERFLALEGEGITWTGQPSRAGIALFSVRIEFWRSPAQDCRVRVRSTLVEQQYKPLSSVLEREYLSLDCGRESVGATGGIESRINKGLRGRCVMPVSIFLVWNHYVANFADI
jgi:hypothetical protein